MSKILTKFGGNPYVWYSIFLVPSLISFAVLKSDGNSAAMQALFVALNMATWFGWSYLILALPSATEAHVAARTVYGRLSGTLKFCAAVIALALLVFSIGSFTHYKLIALFMDFLPKLLASALLGSIGMACSFALFFAMRNRGQSQPYWRCAVDAFDVTLGLFFATVAGLVAMVACQLLFSEMAGQLNVIVAMLLLFGLGLWRVAPYLPSLPKPRSWIGQHT